MNRLTVLFSLLLFAGSGYSQTFNSESDFKKYFTEHRATLDTIEGIWTVKTKQQFLAYDTLYDEKSFTQTVAIVKKDTMYVSYDTKGEAYNVFFSKTDIAKVYLYRIWLKEISQYTRADAVISLGSTMEYKCELPEEYLHFTLGETYEKGDRVVNRVTWTKVFPK